jgi:hypothetical protein
VDVVKPHHQAFRHSHHSKCGGQVGGHAIDIQIVPDLADLAVAIGLPTIHLLALPDVAGHPGHRDPLFVAGKPDIAGQVNSAPG